MVALDPQNMKWRMEVQDAAANLGLMLYNRRDFAEATQQFNSALSTIQALATADPENATYQQNISDTLALLAPAQEADGKLADATETQKRYVELLQRLLPRQGADAGFRLIVGYRELGRLYAEQGKGDLAIEQYRASVEQGERLLAIEPSNAKWLESTEAAKLLLARQSFEQGDTAAAAAQLQPICSTFASLVAKDPKIRLRSSGLRDCLMLSAQVAAGSGDKEKALSLAASAVQRARAVKTLDRGSDAFGIAGALRLLGDMRKASGDVAGAQAAWTEAQAALPSGTPERPADTDEHAKILERLGRASEAASLRSRLIQIGYRVTEPRTT
jgi:tetratricopeptide (TPR) repeat protein